MDAYPSAYRAFISYSHHADKELAPALHAALQRFTKTWRQRRALRIFRDETNLALNHKLWVPIEAALSESEWLLLLASTRAATSEWVKKEVEFWRINRPLERLLIVLTDGEIAWSGADFDWTRTTALPPELAGQFSEPPLYLDLRWAREEKNLSLDNRRFQDAVASWRLDASTSAECIARRGAPTPCLAHSAATAHGHRYGDRSRRGIYERVEPIVAAKGTGVRVALCHVSGRTVADPSGSQRVSDREVLGCARRCRRER
jgi:hypothetical protein